MANRSILLAVIAALLGAFFLGLPASAADPLTPWLLQSEPAIQAEVGYHTTCWISTVEPNVVGPNQRCRGGLSFDYTNPQPLDLSVGYEGGGHFACFLETMYGSATGVMCYFSGDEFGWAAPLRAWDVLNEATAIHGDSYTMCVASSLEGRCFGAIQQSWAGPVADVWVGVQQKGDWQARVACAKRPAAEWQCTGHDTDQSSYDFSFVTGNSGYSLALLPNGSSDLCYVDSPDDSATCIDYQWEGLNHEERRYPMAMTNIVAMGGRESQMCRLRHEDARLSTVTCITFPNYVNQYTVPGADHSQLVMHGGSHYCAITPALIMECGSGL